MDFQKQIREVRQSIREQKEIERQVPKHYCGNTILNVLLEEKEIQCRRRKIKLEIKPIYVSELPGISRIHLCSVLSNLLDNAIEAAGEDGRLFIKLDEVREFRVGEIRNSIQAEQKKKEGHMGLGLGNVRNTLEKYHGTMKTEETKEEFQVRLMLPMEKR